MKKIDPLTSTRFISILFILYAHGAASYYIPFDENPSVLAILRSAPTVVTYLYALSGFVMSLAYFRPGEKFNISGFWTARFVRIYPLYIISFILTCYFYLDGLAAIKPQKILANLFILQAWIPAYSQSFNIVAWSLTVEIFFYAIFPFYILWAHKQPTRKLLWSAIAFWAISQAVYLVLWIGYFPEQRAILIYFPVFHLNSFVMGVVGGIWYLRDGRQEKLKPHTILLVLALSVFLMAGYAIMSTNYYPSLPHDLQPMAGLFAPVLVLIMSALALDKSFLSRIMSNPILVNLGEAAYGIYIFHVPFSWIYERALENSQLPDPRYVMEITFFPLIIAIALFARAYVDPPIRNWMKKIIARISVPLLLLDLAIIAASIIISFRFRFGDGREYLSYRSMGLVMFWSAFLLRTSLSVVFNRLSSNILHLPLLQFVRPIAISTTLGSVILFFIIFAGYSLGWFENFPRSIFVIDWAVVLSLSLLVRSLFRFSGFYSPKPTPVSVTQ